MAPLSETPETAGQVADAPRDNWVDRFAPEWSRPWLRLSRADRPIGTWLLLLPCWWGIALAAMGDGWRWLDLWIAVGCALGAFLMRGAGCTWNDITDRDFDGSVARTRSRPIPSGQVTVKGAIAWMFIQMGLSAVILFTFNRTAILLGFASILIVAIYPFAKRFTWWPQAFLGLAFNWGVLLAHAAHAGTVSLGSVLLYAAGVIWTLFYDTIYAHQDKEDDVLIGVKSTARLFGAGTGKVLSIFMVLIIVLMAAGILSVVLPQPSVMKLVVALGAPWALGWHLWWQLSRLEIDNADVCLRLFRSNRDAGLLVALFLAAAALL